MYHKLYPTRPRFSKEVFALDGSTCAIEKGAVARRYFFDLTYYGLSRI